jgi:hypothetical protein
MSDLTSFISPHRRVPSASRRPFRARRRYRFELPFPVAENE